MKKIRAMLFTSIALVVALVRADPPTDPPADPNDELTLPCDYYSARLPYIGGVMCPVLPGSPPPGCINDGICEYYWCDIQRPVIQEIGGKNGGALEQLCERWGIPTMRPIIRRA